MKLGIIIELYFDLIVTEKFYWSSFTFFSNYNELLNKGAILRSKCVVFLEERAPLKDMEPSS